jgi:predicted O-methyltransferase YrrM
MDPRHARFLYDAAMTGRFKNILEVGCHKGSSTSALVQALIDRGGDFRLSLCDIRVTQELREVVSRSERLIRVFETRSTEVIAHGFDLVIIDGDHRLDNVAAEFFRCVHAGTKTIIAHDTNAGNIADCEGPAVLAEIVRNCRLFEWLEDKVRRDGEFTERGLMVMSRDSEIMAALRPIWEAMIV